MNEEIQIHPKRLGRIRSIIERTKLHEIIICFVLLLVSIAFLASCLIYFGLDIGVSFLPILAASVKLLLGSSEAMNELAGANSATSSDHLVIEAVSFLGSVIAFFATPLIFSVITAKLLISDNRFVIRRTLSVSRSEDSDTKLSIRLYNATETALVNCSYQVIARVRRKSYLEHEVVQSKPLEVTGTGRFSLMLPYVPFAINLPVYKEDLGGNSKLVRLQGYEISKIDKVLLLVRGTVPGLLKEHTEYHLIDINDENIRYGRFSDIDVDYCNYLNKTGRIEKLFSHRRAKKWQGWRDFEMQKKEIWIFGFGSIVNIESLERTLGRKIVDADYEFTELQNYRREWNVAMNNNHSISGYKRYFHRFHEGEANSGGVVDGYIAFLGLRQCEKSNVNGIIFKVEEDELLALDQREKNYRRVDVSNYVNNLRADRVLYCYMPSEEGLQRYIEGEKMNKLFISVGYERSVEDAFKKAGKAQYCKYRASTLDTSLPRLDLIKRKT